VLAGGGGEGDMDGIYIWQPAYLAAVYETDDAKMMSRILEARAEMEQRLLVPMEQDSAEHREPLAAQKAVELLKSERVDKVERQHTGAASRSSQLTSQI
jgi:hypothetical protein